MPICELLPTTSYTYLLLPSSASLSTTSIQALTSFAHPGTTLTTSYIVLMLQYPSFFDLAITSLSVAFVSFGVPVLTFV